MAVLADYAYMDTSIIRKAANKISGENEVPNSVWKLTHSSTTIITQWPVTYACAQSYPPGSGSYVN